MQEQMPFDQLAIDYCRPSVHRPTSATRSEYPRLVIRRLP